ncbi:MAG: VOC family protein [Gammaproteobacteria bacterium]|nr:VOC family protein [Gammaproteobacteria bacterium]
MIDHISTYATDYAATKRFYERVLVPLGYGLQVERMLDSDAGCPAVRIGAFGPPGKPVLWIIESQEAATPRHVAFCAANRASVDAFHAAGIALGAEDFGEPGLRPVYHEHYYGAFLIDPDGNNVEAVCHRANG